jgi:hypothetical protein
VKEGGYDEASLTSLSTADYSCIAPLVKKVMALEPEKVSLSVSSLRAYGLGEELLDEIQKVRATGLTFAPEAGTAAHARRGEQERHRGAAHGDRRARVLARVVEDEALLHDRPADRDRRGRARASSRRAGRRGTIGRACRRARRADGDGERVDARPKPHTPFQWCAMDTYDEIGRKQGCCARRGASGQGRPADARVATGAPSRACSPAATARLADVIEHAYRAGARFDSWEERLDRNAWRSAFASTPSTSACGSAPSPSTARLPWDHLDVGLEDGFLLREYRKAMQNRLSPPCGKAAGMFIHHTNLEDATPTTRKLVCYDCGVACDLTNMRQERIVYLDTLMAKVRPRPPRGPR